MVKLGRSDIHPSYSRHHSPGSDKTSAFALAPWTVSCLLRAGHHSSADDEEAGSGAGCGREAISERVLGGRARGGVPYF